MVNSVTYIDLFRKLVDWRFWQNVIRLFYSRQGLDSVAVLAYTSLIGVVPMLAVMLSLFSVSPLFANFETVVMEQVVSNLMPNSYPVIKEYLIQFSQQAASLKGPGLSIMLITVLLLLWKVDEKLNGLWSHSLQRKWWVSLFHYLGISLLGPLFLGLSLVVSSSLLALPWFVETTPYFEKVTFGLKVVPLILAWVGFTLLYKFVPIPFVAFKIAVAAGFFAMVSFELLKTGFSLYVQWFPSYSLVYGSFAAVPLFLLWLYLIWFIVIWNGAVVVTLSEQQKNRVI